MNYPLEKESFMVRLNGRLTASCLALAVLLAGPSAGWAQGEKSDSKVKITAKADKPDADGKQTVTITLEIDKGWHTYANPPGPDDFAGIPTKVTVSAKKELKSVKIDYPKGTLVKDPKAKDYRVYEGKVTIKATVERAKGDTSPLKVQVKIQACNENSCLFPATVKVPVK
jgi:DsbC/DsbD-like thiol-disulfide interchange protein